MQKIKIALYMTVAFCILSLCLNQSPQSIAHAASNTWTWLGINGSAYKLLADPIHPSVVYAVLDYKKIVKTEDGGSTWIDITPQAFVPATNDIRDIAITSSSPNVIYAASFAGTYRTNDGGKTWQTVHSNLTSGNRDYAVEVSPLDWKEAYLISQQAAETHILRTINGGDTWQSVWLDLDEGLAPQVLLEDFAVAPSAPHIIFASPFNNRRSDYLLKSVDYGQTWTKVTIPSNFWTSIVIDPTNAETIYLGSNGPTAWKSTDGGVNWQPLTNGLSGYCKGFAIDINNTQVIHVAANDMGVFETQDGGLSWSPINNGIQGLTVSSIVVTSRDPLTMFAGVGSAGVWKLIRTDVQDYSVSINNGSIFTNQTSVNLNLTAPSGTSSMMVSNDGGFGGAAWEPYHSIKPWTIIAYGNYVIPRTVYVKFKTNGTTSGVYQDDIILDQTPPDGSIEVVNPFPSASPNSLTTTLQEYPNHIFLPAILKEYHPGFRLVGLLLSATDAVSGMESMLISNEANFVDKEWQPYAQNLDWYVNENSMTTVYVKYRDRAGNELQIYSVATNP